MKILAMVSLVLFMIVPSVGATDWHLALRSHVPKEFLLPTEKLKGLELVEARKIIKSEWLKYYVDLGVDFNKATKTDYSPFSNKWVIGGIDVELGKYTSLDELTAPAFEARVTEIARGHYIDFFNSEYVVSVHKIFDHDTEIFLLKKEIIYLKQNIELIKKMANEETPLPPEPDHTKLFLILGTLTMVVSLLTCVLFKFYFSRHLS